MKMEEDLKKRVVGQNEAITKIASAVRRSRAEWPMKTGLSAFHILGADGRGKTELAKALAEFMFNDENL